MSLSLKYLIAGCIFLVLVGTASIDAASHGLLEGHLKIVAGRPVQLADENTATPAATPANHGDYSSYPLIVLSRDGQKEIARVTVDKEGTYRVSLPPGDYILDVQGRVTKRLRVITQPFTIVPNETVHVDLTILTEFASE